jgi:hypothetical protein
MRIAPIAAKCVPKYLICEPSAVTDLSEPVAEQRVLTIADTIPTNAGKKRLQQIRRSRPG